MSRTYQVAVTKSRVLGIVVRVSADSDEEAIEEALRKASASEESLWDWTDESPSSGEVLDDWEESEEAGEETS